MSYEHLLSPIKVNQLLLKNRIVAAPIGDEYANKALGGAAIVVCGHTIVDYGRSSFARGDEQSAFFKYEVEKTQEKIRQCHRAGARASIEIFHAGQYARCLENVDPIGPCSFVREDGKHVRALNEQGMEEIADKYAAEAKKAKALGFDAIFMHFGHGWLPAQFLSPLFNHRQDAYGGSIENRAKFPLLILQKVREAVGKDFMIDMRISGEECVPHSIKFADTLAFILMAEPYIDCVQISAGLDINHEGNVYMATTNFTPHMPNLHWAKEVKRYVKKIKVSVVGAVMTPEEAEQIIATDDVDLVAFGRSFIADSDWPKKLREGHREDIVPCIRCLQCYHISTNRQNVGCTVNPLYHNPFFEKTIPLTKKKRVVIIGGGPAGIACALSARKRGHEVIVLEQSDRVGGTLNLIALEKYKEDLANYLHYLCTQIAKSDVDVRLNVQATPENVRALAPDSIVIAVGARPIVLSMEKTVGAHVLSFAQALQDPASVGAKVTIIGGGTIGAELALELSEMGREVAIVEMGKELASNGNMLYRIALRHKYEALPQPIKIYYEHTCEKVEDTKVIIRDENGKQQFIDTDTTIVCVGVRSDRTLVESFYGIVPDTYEIGDALRPRKIQEAVMEGYGVGAQL